MKTKVNEIPLVGPKGRRELIDSINSLKERIEEVRSSIIQADFNQKDSTKSDYIKNKPEPLTADDILDAIAQKEYFTFEALSDSTSIYFVSETYEDDEDDEYEVKRNIEVSTDCINWTSKTSSEEETLLATLNAGDKLYIRGKNRSYGDEYDDEYYASYFKTNKAVYVYGNIMSLIYGEDFLASHNSSRTGSCTFAKLFHGVGQYLYFRNDKRLVLPLEDLDGSAYAKMFAGCTHITYVPTLPAKYARPYCYHGMFEGCTGLTEVPNLNSDYAFDGCYKEMFKNCTNLKWGPKELKAKQVNNEAYYGMFEGCTSLHTAPKILAESFSNNSAARMFYGCSNIFSIECHVKTKTPTSTENWLYGVSSWGYISVPKDSEIWETDSPSGVPSGWHLNKTLE